MSAAFQPGLYGKLPGRGDFVTRRLPKQFTGVWDQWLDSSMAASREQLGDQWLDVYLTSPIWRFGLSPGICGDSAWAGVLMPSVDKGGRYFPLTLVAPLANADGLPHLFCADGGLWFEEMERLALSCLEDGQDFDAFDESLKTHCPPSLVEAGEPSREGYGKRGKFACRVSMESLQQTPLAFMDIGASLLNRFMPAYSLWSTAGSETVGASLLVCEGLPPIDAYVALLAGHWAQRGWDMQSRQLYVLATDSVPMTAEAPEAEAESEDPPDFCPLDFSESKTPTRPRQLLFAWDWGSSGISVVGKKRTLNEDALLERSEAGLWAVADGMGGHQAGDVASGAIVEALSAMEPSTDIGEFAGRVEQTLKGVNEQLRRLAGESGDDEQIIGSTVVVLLARENRCVFLWAGDSRLYRYREGKLDQLSQDHSLLDDLANQGLISRDQLTEGGGRCNIITRAVGAGDTLELSRGECEAVCGDQFLLCSDGLDKELTREEIEAVFREKGQQEIARTLIEMAEERGARDNVTVVVVRVMCQVSSFQSAA